MTDTLKVLGQSAPSATTLTDLYTVGSGKSATASSVVVCNRGSGSTTCRISVAKAGAADTPSQYLFYDIPIPGNDSFVATVGITLAATDVIRGYAGNGNLSFNVFGVEVS